MCRIEQILANLDSASSGFAAVSGGLEETRLQIDDLLVSVNTLVEENRRPVGQAVVDAYKRLLSRAMETEMRLATKARADNDATAHQGHSPDADLLGSYV